MLKLTTLYSGSSGNSTLVQSDDANILVDAGFSFPKLANYLNQANLSPSDIDLILITHNHGDHISALSGFLENFDVTVGTHEKLCENLCTGFKIRKNFPMTSKIAFRDLEIDLTKLSHDAPSCYGFAFFDGNSRVAIVTDTGRLSDENIEVLSSCKTILLESNHDLCMLKTGDYAYSLKRRILSEKGHLSNLQAAEAFSRLLDFGKLENLILGHLSQNNNTSELAFLEAQNVLKQKNLVEGKDVNIFVADQDEKGKTVC